MIIKPSLEPRKLIDYDLMLDNGLSFPITIDASAGDTVDWDTSPSIVTFKQSARPHPTDPDASSPAEEITFFISHIISVTKRTRLVMPATPDQKEEWQNLVRSMSRTIQ